MENKNSRLSQFRVFRYNKKKYSEDEILLGIVNNNNDMICYIYKEYFPGIKAMVNNFRSLTLDAADVFQDGLVIAINNVKENHFKGNSRFSTYLTSICRNNCLKQLSQYKKMQKVFDKPTEVAESETDIEELVFRLTFLKGKMDEKCRQIIDLRFGIIKIETNCVMKPESAPNVRFEKIAEFLNIETDNARKRFNRCLEKLRESVFNDRTWNEILTNNC